MRWTLGLLLLFSLPASAQQNLHDQVRCREIAFSQSVESGDIERFAAFIDDDARFVSGGVSRGVEAVVAAWGPFFKNGGPSIKWRPQFVEVLNNGDLALTRGPYRMITRDEQGEPVEHWGTFNSVWRRAPGGDWRVVFDAGNAAAKPPAAEVQALLEADVECAPNPGRRN